MLTKCTSIESYVSKKTFEKYGNNSMWFISPQQIKIVKSVESLFPGKKLFVNNWKEGGALNACGTRFSWDNNYKETSQHALKNAVDIHIIGIDAKEIYEEIKKRWSTTPDLQVITTLEEIKKTPTWVHADAREWFLSSDQLRSLHVVNP